MAFILNVTHSDAMTNAKEVCFAIIFLLPFRCTALALQKRNRNGDLSMTFYVTFEKNSAQASKAMSDWLERNIDANVYTAALNYAVLHKMPTPSH